MTVYFPQHPNESRSGRVSIDVSPAENYGAIQYVFGANNQPSTDPVEAFRQAQECLQGFDFDQDYLAVAGGDPFATVIVSAALGQLAAQTGSAHFNYLRYDRGFRGNDPRYTPVRASI